MRPVLGVSIGPATLRAVVVQRGAIRWAAEATYGGAADLAEAFARLAGESGVAARRARIVLERGAVQLRAVSPAPPLKPAALRRYVALEAPRLFRQNGGRLVTDGVRVAVDRETTALWAAAAPEALVQAALDGCAQAGLTPESLGPAADVLAHALAAPRATGEVPFPDGGTTEVLTLGEAGAWRSRRVAGDRPSAVSWVLPLASLGADAPRFAAAYAATQGRARLELLPPMVAAARTRVARLHRVRLAALGAGLWLLAGAVYAGGAVASGAAATRELAASAPAVDTALALRRQLDAAAAAVAVISVAAAVRSRQVELLAALTGALGDSTYVAALRIERDGTVRLVGYAPTAAGVLAHLEAVPQLRGAKLEGPVTREAPPGRPELDRFSIVAVRGDAP